METPNNTDFEFEKMTEPFVDDDYDSRKGYDEDFLERRVPIPKIENLGMVSKMDDGNHVIPYEHFSLVMHRQRRLAIFTAANVDGNESRKEPEPGYNYSRRGLSGLGKHDIEKWVTDPRVDASLQLPDKFYTKDRKNFDKGHIVRRDDVAWGGTYEEVRRANGDTYHVTNCSPQIDTFNRSNLRGEWGKLENYVMKQSESEKLCVFAGPVLDDENDKIFRGKDDNGDVAVQIPSSFWKVIVAQKGDQLESFGFLIEQDLSETDVEFNVSAEWQGKMISIDKLEDLIPDLSFPQTVRDADQIEIIEGETASESIPFKRHPAPDGANRPAPVGGGVVSNEPVTWDDRTSPDVLKEAIESKNYGTAGRLLDALCDDLDHSARRIDAGIAKDILSWLRMYAWFDRLKQMAQKFEQHAQNDRKVLINLAQARIEMGTITTALDGLMELRARLEELLADPNLDPIDKGDIEYDLGETLGLMGRCYKQYYVNARPSKTEPREYDLKKSLTYYGEAFDRVLGDYLWHGINRVAILNHEERISSNKMNAIAPAAEGTANKILKAIEGKARHNPLQPWDLANRIEANLALGKTREAIDAAEAYLDHEKVDAFNVQSTRRQLAEVWMLDESRPPGSIILPMMAARFAELGSGAEAVVLDPAKAADYEKVWGDTKYKSIGWLMKAFKRAQSVARIGPSKYEGHGTGFLFDGERIGDKWKGKPLLLTNAHVCSNDPEVQAQIPYPSPPEELTAAFLGAGGASETEELEFKELLWTSPPSNLDATLLLLKEAPEGWEPLPITTRTPPATLKGDARLNILGHPKGLDLRVSLQDNVTVDVGSKYVHYKTPTDPGSSGSPVFNQKWDVVALHHAASTQKQANEGIRIDVIIETIKSVLA